MKPCDYNSVSVQLSTIYSPLRWMNSHSVPGARPLPESVTGAGLRQAQAPGRTVLPTGWPPGHSLWSSCLGSSPTLMTFLLRPPGLSGLGYSSACLAVTADPQSSAVCSQLSLSPRTLCLCALSCCPSFFSTASSSTPAHARCSWACVLGFSLAPVAGFLFAADSPSPHPLNAFVEKVLRTLSSTRLRFITYLFSTVSQRERRWLFHVY